MVEINLLIIKHFEVDKIFQQFSGADLFPLVGTLVSKFFVLAPKIKTIALKIDILLILFY